MNREPLFEFPLIDRYVFDIAENATNSFTADLGIVIDQEEDPFVFKTDSGAAQAFIKLDGDETNAFTISVQREEAVVGNYTLTIKIEEEIKSVPRTSSISIEVEITNSDAPPEEEKVEVKEEDKEEEKTTTEETTTKN